MLLPTLMNAPSLSDVNGAFARSESKGSLARRILDRVYELRNVADGSNVDPALQSAADAYQMERMGGFIGRGEPIQLVLPAFPAKSPNPEKTLGALPDYGEVLALGRLNDLCTAIRRLYAPGAYLTICSDGRVFSDLVQVSDDRVDEYGWGVRAIIADYQLDHLDTYNLDDVFPDAANYEAMRQRLECDHAEPLEQLRDRIKRDPEAQQLFNGIHRFMFEDWLALETGVSSHSRNRIRTLTKGLAYAVIRRSNAWSRVVEQQFPDAVRLSIHPQPSTSRKIGVRLLRSADIWRTPWHSVTLFDGKSYSLVTRKSAEASGAKLVYADGKYPYYVAQNHLENRSSHVAA